MKKRIVLTILAAIGAGTLSAKPAGDLALARRGQEAAATVVIRRDASPSLRGFRRHFAGVTPSERAKAAAKYPGLQKPHSSEMAATERGVSRSMSRARAMRRRRSSAWAGRPSSRRKSRSSVARDTPTASASSTMLGGDARRADRISSARRNTGLSVASVSVERRDHTRVQGTRTGADGARSPSIRRSSSAAAS